MSNNNRPDFSNYLVHFTKNKSKDKDLKQGIPDTAFDRLVNILKNKTIQAFPFPFQKAPAVCFTECPWTSLLAHTTQYSPYGVGFAKGFVFSQDGNPVFYIRQDIYEKVMGNGNQPPIDPDIFHFCTPYWPECAFQDPTLNSKQKTLKTYIDFTHEREWRVPHNFRFEYENIEFVILNDYEDMAKFPKELKNAIGREKFILLENYKTIETLWPVHKI